MNALHSTLRDYKSNDYAQKYFQAKGKPVFYSVIDEMEVRKSNDHNPVEIQFCYPFWVRDTILIQNVWLIKVAPNSS